MSRRLRDRGEMLSGRLGGGRPVVALPDVAKEAGQVAEIIITERRLAGEEPVEFLVGQFENRPMSLVKRHNRPNGCALVRDRPLNGLQTTPLQRLDRSWALSDHSGRLFDREIP